MPQNKKNAKPDFLDLDKDGDKKEPMKKAAREMKARAKPRKTLTDKQKEMLEKHKVHHTAKHMALMRKLMREGMSFTAAHKQAQKEVGK